MRYLINKMAKFIDWFEDNFAEEKYLNDEEEWVSYLDLPEYKEIKQTLTNAIEEIKKLDETKGI